MCNRLFGGWPYERSVIERWERDERIFEKIASLFVVACSIWSHAHTRIQLSAMQHQSSSQRVGALLIYRPALVDQHTGGSRLTRTVHRCPKGMAVGGPCDQSAQQYSAETPQIRQHSSTVQKHPKHGSGALSIQGKNCKKIHENHDDQRSVKCPTPGDGYRRRSGTRRPRRLWCVYGGSRGDENRRSQLMWKSVLVKVMTNRL